MTLRKRFILFFIFITFFSSIFAKPSKEQNKVSSNPLESESNLFVKKLGIGYNWGNTMEAWGTGILEIGWGAPVTKKEMFEDLKARGFTTIRLPVAWSFRMDPKTYEIYEPLNQRVNEIVDMAIESGLYVILNIHWDGGWINDPKRGFSKNYNKCMEKYVKIWEQISERYKNYDEHLIFESLNEEGCWDDLWNRYGGPSEKKQTAYEILNRINQQFVNVVRKSGGNNENRYLLIAGYGTDIDLTCCEYFKIPNDPKNRCMVSVHYYTPSTFAILTENASWGKCASTWGTPAEINALHANMKKMKTNFTDKGIGVIIGEYGCPVLNKEPDSVLKYLTEVAKVSYDLGFCPVLWAGSVDIYSRRNLKFDDARIGDMYKELSTRERN